VLGRDLVQRLARKQPRHQRAHRLIEAAARARIGAVDDEKAAGL